MKKELDGVNAHYTEETLAAALKVRNSGTKEAVNITYKRNGEVLSGPHFATNGMTGKVILHRFEHRPEYFAIFRTSTGGRNSLSLEPPVHIRSVISQIEELLLLGTGNLEERFIATLNKIKQGLIDDSAMKYQYAIEDGAIVVRRNDANHLIASFDSNEKFLEIKRLSGRAQPSRIMTYREISAKELPELLSVVPVGTTVVDTRKGSAEQHQYTWNGQIPDTNSLGTTLLDPGDRTGIPSQLIFGGLVVLGAFGLGIVSLRRAKSMRSHPKKGS
ncbi:hypothetical protein QPK87_05640 [Kamptonema cortianum]|nr:hypothetical protein [Geitlerinema splendidum]MDK3156057.1 hypothetical protein [Kamptonema cortianum]